MTVWTGRADSGSQPIHIFVDRGCRRSGDIRGMDEIARPDLDRWAGSGEEDRICESPSSDFLIDLRGGRHRER